MPVQAIEKLKTLETEIYFMTTEIPQQSCLCNSDFIEILHDISSEIEKTIKILKEKKVSSDTLVN